MSGGETVDPVGAAGRGRLAADGAEVFHVGGEVGRDLARVDWAATPLGPPAGWPQSLRTAVGILLSSRFPMWMAWGPRLTFFCNAGYRRDTLGRKYPWALGRPASEVWAEIWGDIGPRIETVLGTGQATWDEALLLFLERSGYPEETYHTFSYSPLRDDAGTVVGMLCVVSEDTDRVIGERRMAMLRDLGSDPSVVRTEQEMLAFAGRQLAGNRRDLPFTLTYLFDDDGGAELAAATGIPAGHPAAPRTLRAGDPAGVWPAAVPARGERVVVPLDGAPFTGLPRGDWPEPPTRALVVPLLRHGSAPYGFLVAALNRYPPLDDGYRGFVELAAGHLATGIAGARSYQAQQRRAEELAALDRAKTTFFSNLSHEFRTPLTLITGPVDELRDRLGDTDAQAREELELIRRNGLRLGKLVNTLLDFSRIEAGRMRARFEPVDLAAVTAELAGVFRSAIEKAGLVKPFSAAELLARVRANVESARLRTQHARWRTALVDSLQEAFFVCDENGAVVEINAAFTEILGYGPEGLPYPPVHPWWPNPDDDPGAHRLVADTFAELMGESRGTYTVPLTHRDGHRVWISAAFSQVDDPDTGHHVIVGTFRDVTAERYAIQRETAVAALSLRLSQAGSLDDALTGALDELRRRWRAERALAVVFGDDTPAVTATGTAVAWDELTDRHRAALAGLRDGPSLAAATDAAGTAVGVGLEHPHGPMVLWLDLGGRRPFSGQDQTLLSLLAGHLAQGLARAHQIDRQRETALALQRAILGPSDLPGGFAVRYEPAARPLEVGGDWYDTVPLPGGRIGIVVGDCVGRGLRAATVMGQLRSACRALLLQDSRPDRVLHALDRFAAGVPGATCTTVFCGVLDPRDGRLVYASAGHPPGILVRPDGDVLLLDEGRSTPLAIPPVAGRPCAEQTLPARSTLLLYTDGLVERRRRPLTDGIGRAGEAVRHGRETGIDDLAGAVMSRMAPAGGYDDDVALLLYRHPAPLAMSFPAEAAQLARVRTALRGWLLRCDVPPRTVQNVLVAAGEACANAVEHGHRGTPGATVRVRAEALADRVRLVVTDSGRWRPPRARPDAHRGRGIALMRAMMQHVTVTPGPGGTTVDMQTRIVR